MRMNSKRKKSKPITKASKSLNLNKNPIKSLEHLSDTNKNSTSANLSNFPSQQQNPAVHR